LCSTAEWTKFAPTLFSALQKSDRTHPDKVALEGVKNALHVKIPHAIEALFDTPIVHQDVVAQTDIEAAIDGFLEMDVQ
jgi:threonine synthase